MKKIWKKIKSYFMSAPLIMTKDMEIDLSNLKSKTKAELEKLGRKVGIELDKRLTKDKLIKQIKKHCK
tara:strand:+ start:814 stop:1017 length:204 start_codon:yes stop_codon:yes gene_type:complete